MITNNKQSTPPPTSIDLLLNEKQTAELLGVAPGSLSVWRATKRYPALKYIKVGASVRYRLSDIEGFLRSRTVGAAQ
jgi:hypothetical protein